MVAFSYIKSVLRSVKSSVSRFAAIFAIVALGVGFFAGLLSATPDMRHSVAVYYQSTRFMDLQVMSNLGMADADVNALGAVPGVLGVRPGMTVDLLAATGEGDTLVLRTHAVDMGGPDDSSTNAINCSVLVEGRWPQSTDECVVEYSSNILGGLRIGDTLTFTADNRDLADTLSHTGFTVVGVVSTSYYLNMTQRGYTTVGNGRLGGIVHLPWESYATDYYTEVYVTMENPPPAPFSQDYLDRADALAQAVERLSETQKYVRRDAIREDAEAQLEDARQQLMEAEAEARGELGDAMTELTDGEQKLADARMQLEDGWRAYSTGVTELNDGRALFETEIADAEAELADAWLRLEDARIQLEDGWQALLDGEDELEENRPLLEDGRAQLEAALAEFSAAERDIADAQAEVDAGRRELDEGRTQLEAAALALEDVPHQLAQAAEALEAGSAQLAEGWRAYQEGLQTLETLDSAIGALESNMALLDQILAQAQDLDAQEMVVWAEEFLVSGAGTVDEIRERQAAGTSTHAEDALVELYDAAAQAMADTDALAAYLSGLQEEYRDAQAVVDALKAQRSSAQQQLSEAALQLEAGSRELELGNQAVMEGRRAYEQGLIDYELGLADLEAGEVQWQEGAALLEAGRAELEANRPQLEEAVTELAQKEAEFLDAEAQLEEARAQLEAGEIEYADGLARYEQGLADFRAGRETGEAELADAERQLAAALSRLRDGEAELARGETELGDGWAQYLSGEQELDDKLQDAQDEITAAQDKLRDIESPQWYILTRESNPGYVTYKGDSEKIEAIARVFPIFFFLVATLVASTTMTRMVEEERGNIGTLKALGYTGGHIAAKFIFYATAAALLGSALGLIIGLRLFPATIYNAYGMMYNLPPLVASDHMFYGALSTAAIYVGIMLATLGAIGASLKENAASLMRPKAPPQGKRIFLERITPLWRRMKFTHKVTARNLIRYKKRFFMTVVGIFGCTALLLCGFGLRDSISDIVSIQFGDIFTYNLEITLKHDGDHRTDRRIRAVLEDSARVNRYIAVGRESVRICAGTPQSPGQRQVEVTLTTVDNPADLSGFINLRQRLSGTALPLLGDDTVYLSEKAAATLGLEVGDAFCMEDGEGKQQPLILGGIVENYVQGYLYMTGPLFAATFGEPCAYTTLLAHGADDTADIRDATAQALLVSPNVGGVAFTTTLQETFDEMLTTIDYIVVVLIVSAGLLAFVVMYNLTNINITERMKELATIKVLGFTGSETAGYIFRETSILALVGAVVGLVGGFFLHRFIILTVEVDNMMFGRIIKPLSYVLALVITLAFSLVVNLFMTGKLRAINMAEALKAPE